jgi:hypothetical protein
MSWRALFIAGALVLALAAPTGAVVHKLTTGRDIASRAIQPRHLSVTTQKLGWLHKTRVSNRVPFSYLSQGPKTVTVSCPPGKTLLTGGFGASGSDVIVFQSAPTEAGNGWTATAKYVGGELVALLDVYALCAG